MRRARSSGESIGFADTSRSLNGRLYRGDATEPDLAAPLGSGVPDSGTFDSTAAPVVEICQWNGAACSPEPIARFTTSPTKGAGSLDISVRRGLYLASWDLTKLRFETRRTFRIRVLQGATELGAVSVDVARGRWALSQVGGESPLQPASILPIRFGIADGGSMVIGPEGGIVTDPTGRVELSIPSGALSAPTSIRVAIVSSQSLPGISPASILGPVVSLQPDGLVLNVPAQLRITYPTDGKPPVGLALFHYVPALRAAEWMQSNLQIDADTVRAPIGHFSLWFLGRWSPLPDRPIVYQVSPELVTRPGALDDIRHALDAWEKGPLAGTSISFVLDQQFPAQPDLFFRMANFPLDLLADLRGLGRTLGSRSAGFAVRFVELNLNVSFMTTEEIRSALEATGVSIGNGLQAVLEHEIGHALGLRHHREYICDPSWTNNWTRPNVPECHEPPVMAATKHWGYAEPSALGCIDIALVRVKYPAVPAPKCADRIEAVSPLTQVARENAAVGNLPRVRVLAADGATPVPGVTVWFAREPGEQGSSVTEGVKITDANGEAEVGSWTVGSARSTPYKLHAGIRVSTLSFDSNDPGFRSKEFTAAASLPAAPFR